MYIADSENLRVRKVTISSGIIATIAGTGLTGLSEPYGVAVDSSGNVYIADTYNYRVLKVTASTGIINTIAGSGVSSFLGDGSAATSANMLYPHAAAVDSAGNIYIADLSNHRIRKVTKSTGIITTYAGMGYCDYSGDGGEASSATLCEPSEVALDSSGNVYIADHLNSCVRKVTVSSGIITTIAGTSYSDDDDGDDYDGDDYDGDDGDDGDDSNYYGDDDNFNGDGIAATSASLSYPHGVAVDASGSALTTY